MKNGLGGEEGLKSGRPTRLHDLDRNRRVIVLTNQQAIMGLSDWVKKGCDENEGNIKMGLEGKAQRLNFLEAVWDGFRELKAMVVKKKEEVEFG